MIGIVCALKCEASGLIDRLSLKPHTKKTPFPIYQNGNFSLIISGIGKLRAATATGYLHALCGCEGWFNLGVGGHRDFPVGEGVFAHQVFDCSTKEAYYPTFGWKLREKSASIWTVDRVETDYEGEGVYEMEAAGFCRAALCFTTAELVHCYKVVSDNRTTPPTRSTEKVRELIAPHLDGVEKTLWRLADLVEDLSDPVVDLEPFLSRWHFTETERHKLKRLLIRWSVCYPDKKIQSLIEKVGSGKEVIQVLERCFH